MSLGNSQINSRLVYENATKVLAQAGVDLASAKLTQSDLVLEQQCTTTQTQYTFPILTTNNGPSGTKFNTEIRLNQQDSFVVAQMGLFLIKAASSTDSALICHTYPSPGVFSTANVALAAETIYNSFLTITINNDVVMPVWHLGRHRMVNQSQQVAAATNQNGIAQDQIDLSSDGFLPVEPNVLFIGSKNTVIVATMPAAFTAVETNQRLRLWYRGVLAQNSTIIT